MPEPVADREVIEEAARAAADRAMNQHRGNAVNALRRAMRENEEQRVQLADLERKLAEFKTKVPADGSVVLTAAEGKEWEGYKALGYDHASEAAAALDGYEKLIDAETARTFAESVTLAANELGWNKHALHALLTTKGLAAELRDVVVETDEGRKTEKLLHVRPADNDKATWELVDQYVTREFPDWTVLLESTPRASDADTGGDDGASDDTDAAGEPTMRTTEQQNGRRSAYARAGATNGGGLGKGNDGVRFPAQRAPTPRGRITKKELQDLADAKNKAGEYNAF
jgi:hypothetical protein